MRWRLEPGGYLAKILTATVYDVAVRVAVRCAMHQLALGTCVPIRDALALARP